MKGKLVPFTLEDLAEHHMRAAYSADSVKKVSGATNARLAHACVRQAMVQRKAWNGDGLVWRVPARFGSGYDGSGCAVCWQNVPLETVELFMTFDEPHGRPRGWTVAPSNRVPDSGKMGPVTRTVATWVACATCVHEIVCEWDRGAASGATNGRLRVW